MIKRVSYMLKAPGRYVIYLPRALFMLGVKRPG